MSKQNCIDRLSEEVKCIQKCLECTICLELMTAPVKTRCGHSFCQKCIGKVLNRNATCPLCKKILNKRGISKDDHLESCIQKFKNLIIAIQTDSHIDILSHLKQPRDTRESCSNSGSSQSSVSHKRKPTRKQSTRSKQSTNFKANRTTTSQRTVIDCYNPRYNTNLSIQRSDLPSSSRADVHCLPVDANDNALTPEVKVRTWIHSFIDEEELSSAIVVDDEARPCEENTSRVKKDKELRSDNAKNPGTDKLKYNAVHAKVRAIDRKRSVEAGKLDVEERGSRDGSLSTTNASAVDDLPFSADTTWTRVREIGKEMRGKKKKVRKLDVSTERSTGKNPEKNIENSTEESSEMRSSGPRIIEDIPIELPLSRYKSLNKSASDDVASTEQPKVSNQPLESNSWQRDAIDKKPDLLDAKVTREVPGNKKATDRNRERLSADDEADLSVSESNYHSANTSFITLTGGDQLRIKSLNSRQMNEIIGVERDPPEELVNANDRSRYLEEEAKGREEADMEVATELCDSPSSRHRQRLIVLTPEKLNESVLKRNMTQRDGGARTPVSKSSCRSAENRTPLENDGVERTTMTAVAPHSRSSTPSKLKSSFRLSLQRNLRSPESPFSSQVSLRERLSQTNNCCSKISSGRKSVASSVSEDGPSVDRLASVRRDLSSQIVGKNCPRVGQAAANVSSRNIVEGNGRKNIDNEVVRQNSKLPAESTSSRKSRDIGDPVLESQGCGVSIKFTQLGTMIRRRDVRYYYHGKIKYEQRLPGKIRVSSVYNMQLSVSKSEIEHRMGNKSRSCASSPNPLSDSQDLTDVTVLENVHYASKSVANPNITMLETTRLPFDIPASSTPKLDAGRRADHAEAATANRPSTVEETLRSPPRADQSATRKKSSSVHSIKLLSPDKDSQLQFLTIDSPMNQRGQSRLANFARPVQPEAPRGGSSASAEDNKLDKVRDSQPAANVPSSSFGSREFQPVKKRKRTRPVTDEKFDRSKVDDDSSDSAVSVNSQASTVMFDMHKDAHRSSDETSSRLKADPKRRRLGLPRDRINDVIPLDSDDDTRAHERKFKRKTVNRILSDSDSSARVAKKLNRNKSDDRSDQASSSITNTPTKRRSAREASDENLRIRSIVDKWCSEHSATQKRSIEGTRDAQDTVVKPRRLAPEERTTHRPLSLSTSSDKRGSAKSNEKNTDLFESNSVFDSEGLELLTACQLSDKRSSREQKSQSSMDPFNDIINKVLLIERSQQSNPDAARSAGVVSGNDGTNEGGDLLQDNFDEIIAEVELPPQSEDLIPCSELPAPHPDRNRTLTEQNTSSCAAAMTNEPRYVPRQMTAASSTADIFEYCGYSAGKSARKTPSSGTTSGNSDKENTVSHQRKHDEEDRRDKKNVSGKSSDGKAGREKIASKNNASQEKRGSFDRAADIAEKMSSRTEIDGLAGAPSQPDGDGKARGRAGDGNKTNTKDLSAEYDTLMDITLQQVRLKMIEEDLFGCAAPGRAEKLSSRDNSPFAEEHRTPRKRKKRGYEKNAASSQEHSADEDDIVENTPETKMRNTPKVTSSSMTSLRRGDVSTTTLSKGQRATTSGVVVSSSTKRTAGDACRRPDLRGKLRFVCSGLTAAQVANVQKFARLHNADYAQQFDPAVTHVIVNTSGADNAAKSTLKYLQGIAHRKWVVSFKWIDDCIARRTLLAEDPYEATTQSVDVNGPGPRNSRLSNRGLFEDFAFLCIGPYENVSLAQYQDLLRATGATVVDSLEALAAEEQGIRGVVIQGDTQDDSTIEYWYQSAQAAPILIDWIVECISHYRLFQISPQTLSAQNYCSIGYPRELIGDEGSSDTSG